MKVHTNEADVAEARRGVLELLLVNHPLDCPICDKAGECWLQNYTARYGSPFSRTVDPRRKAGKRLDIGERMLLDQERCVLCRRCVRFCREITHTGELAIFEQGDKSILDVYDGIRMDNEYSMCTADICPVGALETKDFHHKMRVWFLQETASVCPSCANGCNIMISESRNRIWRLIPRRNDAVNDTWMCDHGRLNYGFVNDAERLRHPAIMSGSTLTDASWEVALERAASALGSLVNRDGGSGSALGAVVSPHLTNEENFRFGELLKATGIEHVAMAVRRGSADNLLVKAEKAANAQGVRTLGLVNGADDGMSNLVEAIEKRQVRGLYICGDDFLEVLGERARPLLAGLEVLVVQTLRPRTEFSGATVIFPTTTFAEKDGTFTNHAGRIQRIHAAITPPPDWITDGEIFTRLMNLLTGSHSSFDLSQVWQSMTNEHALGAASLEEIDSLGKQLPGAST
jgi:NADH-quinone oxidoreductase subunit G